MVNIYIRIKISKGGGEDVRFIKEEEWLRNKRCAG